MDRNLEVHTIIKSVTLLHFWTGIEQQMMHRMSGQTRRGKDNDHQQNIAAYITKLLQMPEDTIIQFISRQTNCKMLINVHFDQFLNIKVSQGSVATRLRCDGIFNITKPPLLQQC